MTQFNNSFSILRTAEFVLPGHPDKLADAIADAIVKQARRLERRALVGVEVALHRDVVFIDGRVACNGAENIDFKALVKDVYKSAGYGGVFAPLPHRLKLKTDLCLGPLWPGEAKFREVADDQSIITGYACSTPGTHHLPVEHALVRHLAFGLYRLGRAAKNLRLGPDGKLIVFVRESDDGNSWTLERVSVSAQHAADWNAVQVRRAIHKRVLSDAKDFAALVPGLSVSSSLDLLVNEAGDFVEGGPHGDNGLSGKKLVVDFYGPRVPIGGGAMSGKDFWKADRAGPLIARDLAVAAVQRLGCKACTVTLAIFPGDRQFRIASAQSHGATHKVVVHSDAQQGGAHPSAPASPATHTQTISNIDPSKLAGLVDLRLCSKTNWPSEADNLIDVARWGHFVPMNAWNIARNSAPVAACTV